MSPQSYFDSLAVEQQRLIDHSFSHRPSEADVLSYAMDLNDKIDAICASLHLRACKDIRGRWIVLQSQEAM